MAAGLGFKTFTTGEVLTAADVNGYLMQGVLVFASEAARNSAITSPQEGQFAYTKDNNSLWYYTGSAWAASGATGDIEGVTAGVGISGGGTSGTVTITNSMATEIDAKGDLVVGTGADTFARLPVGTNGYTLVADSVETTGLKWVAPAAASFVGCSVFGTNGTQSITNNTNTAITWDSEDFDSDGFHSTVTNTSRFTIPTGKGGKYLVSGTTRWDGDTAGNARELSIYKNGALVKTYYVPVNAQFPSASITHTLNLVATDYVEIYVFQNSGGTRTIQVSGGPSFASITFLGA